MEVIEGEKVLSHQVKAVQVQIEFFFFCLASWLTETNAPKWLEEQKKDRKKSNINDGKGKGQTFPTPGLIKIK